jgi:hypothetical protein
MNNSRNYHSWLMALSLLLGLLGLFESALAAPRASDSSAAIKKAQGIIRQLTQEKSALVAEKATWEAEKTTQNAKLASLEEILNKYKEKGVWEQLAELDPLTGIGKVATENVVQDYKYKLQQLKITPFKPAEADQSGSVTGEQDSASAGSEAAKQ